MPSRVILTSVMSDLELLARLVDHEMFRQENRSGEEGGRSVCCTRSTMVARGVSIVNYSRV